MRLYIEVPADVAEQYEAQAKQVNVSVEKVMSDRLRTCVLHTSGRGLYFNDDERAQLERITGGHTIASASVALTKIKTVVNLRVGNVDVELNERILARATSRAKAMRKSLDDWIRKEVIEGIERSTGMRPW